MQKRKEKRNTMSRTGYLSWKQNTKKRSARNWDGLFSIPWRYEFSTIELVKGVAERVKKAMCLGAVRRTSNRVSFNSMGRSKTIGGSVDYYRTAAVQDCIEFIHTSFSRSNSSTTTKGEEYMCSSFKKL